MRRPDGLASGWGGAPVGSKLSKLKLSSVRPASDAADQLTDGDGDGDTEDDIEEEAEDDDKGEGEEEDEASVEGTGWLVRDMDGVKRTNAEEGVVYGSAQCWECWLRLYYRVGAAAVPCE